MIILTLQEIFDKAASHLLIQNKRLTGGTIMCLYRGPNGLKCAIGAIIPDELYQEEFERKSVRELIEKFNLFPVEQSAFLYELQQIHDNHPVEQWKTELTRLAEDFNLSTTILDQF